VDLRWLLKKRIDFQTSGVYDVSSGPYFGARGLGQEIGVLGVPIS